MENAFAEGSLCSARYSDMLRAYERLCDRLGVVDDDRDVEIIIGALMDIERELSRRMFAYGVKFADRGPIIEQQAQV